ncbi:MAG TPA: mannose-1-phosphate guanylyltransferase [Candidatus Saccharimonadales bacterium]|nr:mannose-1-phosphate guanylyltransferase [Candidatus Saccharimonadales bacterium]
MPRLYALILSGGAGTRLWPRSRRKKPKQFLDLVAGETMLQDTVARISELIPMERIFVAAPPEHRALIHEQLPELRNDHVVVEPYPRGNAAAIGLSMAALHAFDPDAVVAVLPSDHVITKTAAFRSVLIAATAAAEAGYLVTLGIRPDRADTGFGYIEAGEVLPIDTTLEVRRARRFIEKPKREVAERMLAAGGHYWNAGMFVWRVTQILSAYREHLPRTAAAIDALGDAVGTPRYESVLAEVWEETDRTTIDYGIAERANNMAVVPADIGWSDVGDWSRLAELRTGGSGSWSAGDHIEVEGTGSYVFAPGKTVVTIGLSDLVVVETDDVLLVASRDRAAEVKQVVDRLQREQSEHLL